MPREFDRIGTPFHFVEEGSTIDQLPLERFIGPALVYAVETERYITKEHVAGIRLDGAHRESIEKLGRQERTEAGNAMMGDPRSCSPVR